MYNMLFIIPFSTVLYACVMFLLIRSESVATLSDSDHSLFQHEKINRYFIHFCVALFLQHKQVVEPVWDYHMVTIVQLIQS